MVPTSMNILSPRYRPSTKSACSKRFREPRILFHQRIWPKNWTWPWRWHMPWVWTLHIGPHATGSPCCSRIIDLSGNEPLNALRGRLPRFNSSLTRNRPGLSLLLRGLRAPTLHAATDACLLVDVTNAVTQRMSAYRGAMDTSPLPKSRDNDAYHSPCVS
jgi:hypothetical protein